MDQLGLAELRDAVARLEAGERPGELRYGSARIYSTQLHRILSVPLASVLLAWVGVPLGMRGFVRSRAWGMIVALALLVGYYSLFVYVQDASRMGHAPAYLLVWIPNATLLVAGAALVWSARRIH
jgi:lipopolysaccharide export LptBFGC system permease protein LptF